MKSSYIALTLTVLMASSVVVALPSQPAFAQQMKDDVEQFAADLHFAMQRSTLTEQQKQQMRQDLEKLRQAHQNHDRIAAFRAIKNFRSYLDSGAFQPEDKQRIDQDLKQIREAREDRSGQM